MACVLSRDWLFATPWTVTCDAPLSMEFSRRNTGVGCQFVFKGIFLTQELNLRFFRLLYCQWILYCWTTMEAPKGGLCLCAKSLQLCLTLCDPTDCRPPGSPGKNTGEGCHALQGHGVLQARILKWVAMPSSRGSSWPRDETGVSPVSCIGSGVFTTTVTWEAQKMAYTFLKDSIYYWLCWKIVDNLYFKIIPLFLILC